MSEMSGEMNIQGYCVLGKTDYYYVLLAYEYDSLHARAHDLIFLLQTYFKA